MCQALTSKSAHVGTRGCSESGSDRMKFTRRRLSETVIAGSLLAGLLGGCRGVPSSEAPLTLEESPILSDDSEAAPVLRAPQVAAGPLDEFMVQIFGRAFQDVTDPQEFQQMHRSLQAERNEFIAACMLEQGFAYEPFTDFTPPSRIPLPGEVPQGVREWVERWGFGVSATPPWTSFAPSTRLQTRSAGIRVIVSGWAGQEMSEAEVVAWHQAMYGVTLASLPPEMRLSWEGFPWSDVPEKDLGCETRWWLHQELPPTPFQGLQDEIDRFDASVEANPRTLELDALWASCMIDAGESGWSNPRQPEPVLRALFAEDQIPAEVLVAWDWAAAPEGPPEVDRTEFREREFALALADWDCREQLDYDAALRAINLDLQQQFVNQHRTELEAWVEYAEQQRASG